MKEVEFKRDRDLGHVATATNNGWQWAVLGIGINTEELLKFKQELDKYVDEVLTGE